MKKYSFIAILLLAAACNQEEKTPGRKGLIDPSTVVHNPRTINGISKATADSMPVMSFRDSTHNFGNITEGERVTYDFAFTNTGHSPLLIQSAEGSCGCTVADYPREPIAPGAAANMKVIFSSAGKQGHQEKDVAITNNTLRGVQHLFIQAEVAPQSK